MPRHRFPHDASYKILFGDPALVESLLRDFIPEDFINDLDFSTLQQATGEYITEDFKERHNDIIWKLRWKDTWCYIFLMLEFQSSQHSWMALRMLTYTALLWENLIKTGYLKPGDKLPPVFPIVLYNGDTPWRVATDISDLITRVAPTLDAYQPEYKYYILDEKRIATEKIARAKGAAKYIVEVEQAENRAQIFRLAVDFDSHEGSTKTEAIHLAMLEWMDKKLKYMPSDPKQEALENIKEETMLAELIEKYKRPYIEAGYAEGMSYGREQGLSEGINLGREQGLNEGMSRGREQGLNEGMSRGREQGLSEGITIGESRGETRGMLSIINDMLEQKFGPIPASWELCLAMLTEPAQLMEVYRKLSKANTQEEANGILKNLPYAVNSGSNDS